MHFNGREQQILFHLLKGEDVNMGEEISTGTKASVEQQSLSGTEIDFEALIQLLQRHRLLFLAEPLLKTLPQETRQRWKEVLQQRTLRSHQLLAETLEIITQFQAAGVRVLPLKGAVLAQTLYGDIGARHFNDIDLLVHKEDLDKSRELLQKMQYRQQYPDRLTGRKWKTYSTYKKDMGFFSDEKRTFIELHYGIYVHELLRDTDESKILENTEAITVRQQEIRVLDHETTFVYLVYHGCLHQYFRLFWLRDVAECLARWEMDHQRVTVLVRELGLERLLGTSLHLVKHYFGTEIPEHYAPFLANDTTIHQLVNACHKRTRNPEQLTLKTKINKHLFLMKLKPGFSYKWAVLKSIFQRWRIRKFMGGH